MKHPDPEEFLELTFDFEDEEYRMSNGETVKFSKEITCRLNGSVGPVKLAFTRAWMGLPLNKPVPVLRIDGIKYLLDGWGSDGSQNELEVAAECVTPVSGRTATL